jgi:CSLREA domain-containing protein
MNIHFNPKRSFFKSVLTLGVAVALALPAGAVVTASGNDQPAAASAYFTVNATFDEIDSAPGDGKCQTISGACTLRAAIQETNKLAGWDTISVPPGFYKLSILGTDEDKSKTGDLDITDSLSIKGSGTKGTVIDGQTNDRVFDIIGASTNVDISGVTIQNGTVKAEGGGIRNTGSLRLDDSLVQFSKTVKTNHTDSDGGGIWSKGNLSLNRTTISNNIASDFGGGINNATGGTLTLTNAIVSNNKSGYAGGGIVSFGGPGSVVTITNTTISGNTAVYIGGGLSLGSSGGSVTLNASTVSGNSSECYGGGIYTYDNLTINSSTISGNKAQCSGGGIYYSNYSSTAATDTLVLNSTTIANNNVITNLLQGDQGVGLGGGIYMINGILALSNTLIAVNTSGYSAPDCGLQGVQVNSNGHNLIGKTTDCNYPAGGGDLRDLDPGLGPLRNNGGPTFTHPLLSGSQAIDAGSNQNCPFTDQTGFTRPSDGNGDGNRICDIGAFEFRNP